MLRKKIALENEAQCFTQIYNYIFMIKRFANLLYSSLYAVKVQRSLAPLSRFRGSHIPSAHEQQCCRFQSYANSAIAYEIYKRNLHCVNHIPGIHDNGPRDQEL